MPGISDLQDDPRVNVRQRPTPAGVDGVQHEDGQLMVHDGAGQGGISSLPMQVDIAGQTHILSYLTPGEQARLRAGGGGIAADGGQIYGPGGVPAFADGAAGGGAGPSGSGGGGAGSGGSGGGEASPGDEGAEAAAAAGGVGNAGANNGPSGTSADPNSSPNSVAGRAEVGTDPRGGIAAGNRADPGIQDTGEYGAQPTTGSLATDIAGIGYGASQGFAADPLDGIVGLATRASGFGIAQDVATAGIAAASRAGVSVGRPSTNDVDGPGGQGWADGSAAGYYIPGTISPLARDVASGAAIASESAGSTPGTTTTSYTGPDLSGTFYGREGDWHGGDGLGRHPGDNVEWYADRGYDVFKVGADVWQVVKSRAPAPAADPAPEAPDYPDDWSEADFLADNPDVAAAVEQGLYPSGYSFDQSFRRFTGGTGWDDRADTPGQSLDPRYSSDVYDRFLARNGRRQPVDVNTYYYG